MIADATTIKRAAQKEWPDALALAMNHLSADIRPARVRNALALIAEGAIPPDGILVAKAGAHLRGAVVSVLLPGACGLCWLPKAEPADDALEDRLLQNSLDWLRAGGAKLAQAILNPLDIPLAAPLLRCGFRHITQLQFFEHALGPLPASTHQDIGYLTYSDNNRALFQATLLRTYEGTLDCPELNNTRTMDEVLAGHRAQGDFRSERWLLALHGNEPVAVALATKVPNGLAWDLSYLGVVPAARRRGFGMAVALHVLNLAKKAQAPKVVLAVDGRNQPAIQLYGRLGMVPTDFREVYLYFWDRTLAGKS